MECRTHPCGLIQAADADRKQISIAHIEYSTLIRDGAIRLTEDPTQGALAIAALRSRCPSRVMYGHEIPALAMSPVPQIAAEVVAPPTLSICRAASGYATAPSATWVHFR
jgi:hypothetical protein